MKKNVLSILDVKDEIEEKGGEAMALHVDVSDQDSTREMARKTIENFGRIDILVNNAGIFADIIK